jgi:hypothetical protein
MRRARRRRRNPDTRTLELAAFAIVLVGTALYINRFGLRGTQAEPSTWSNREIPPPGVQGMSWS